MELPHRPGEYGVLGEGAVRPHCHKIVKIQRKRHGFGVGVVDAALRPQVLIDIDSVKEQSERRSGIRLSCQFAARDELKGAGMVRLKSRWVGIAKISHQRGAYRMNGCDVAHVFEPIVPTLRDARFSASRGRSGRAPPLPCRTAFPKETQCPVRQAQESSVRESACFPTTTRACLMC